MLPTRRRRHAGTGRDEPGGFPPNPVLTRGDARYDLAESTVQHLTFGALSDIAGGAAALADLGLGYGPRAGSPALRRAVARACGVEADEVLTFPGTMLGLFLLASELCRTGGEALLATPCYGPTRAAVERAGARVRESKLRFEDGYCLDVGRISMCLTRATRLVCVASPQNPSGVRVPASALRALLDTMAVRAPRALLLIDETYRDATYGETASPSAAAMDRRVVTVGSLSKAHGAPGLRIGWLTVPDPALRERVAAARHDMIISGSVLDEAIAAALLAQQDRVLAPRRRQLARALEVVEAWRAGEAGRIDWVRPEAGGLCCVRLRPRTFCAAAVERFWAALPRHGLRLAPGTWFGEESRVFRLGFGALPPADLPPALRLLSRSMDEALEPPERDRASRSERRIQG